MTKPRMQLVPWSAIRKEFSKTAPDVTALIDECIDFTNDTFVKMRYKFGDHILKDGNFLIPDESGGFTSYNRNSLPNEIKDLLDYDWPTIPFGLVYKGYLEAYWISTKSMIPLGQIFPGRTCGLREALQPDKDYMFHTAWSLTAGSRSMFQLANVNEQRGIKRLANRYNINLTSPRSFDEHWDFFSSVARSPKFHTDWSTEIVFFNVEFVKAIQGDDPRFRKLKDYFLDMRWRFTAFSRNQGIVDLVWDEFLLAIEQQYDFKGKTHVFDIARHLIDVACGGNWGYVPASLNNEYGPITEFADMLTKTYKTTHCPTFMVPGALGIGKDAAVYCSLQHAKHLASSPRQIIRRNNKEDLVEIRKVLEYFFDQLQSNKSLKVENSILEKLPHLIQFDYFHPETDYRKNCKHPKEIVLTDKRFLYNGANNKENQDFCHTNLFFKGCVKITRNNI